ncbi:MAG: DUF4139 domain-containing protein [Betaproteobacteria bacterium]
MPRNACLASFLLLLTSVAFAGVEAPITRVVLYPGSASIERTAQVPAGANAVEINGLPNNFDTKTLLVRAGRGVRIGQVIIQEAAQTNGLHPREKELQKKIRALKDQLDTLDIEVKSANLVTAYLERMGSGDKDGSDARNLTGVTGGIEASATRALQRAQRAEINKRSIKEELEKLEFELAQFKSGGKNSRSVTVQTAAEVPGIIHLSYQINRAGWQPAYRAAIDTTKSTVDLDRMAQVSQKTGEDWNGVKLVLSTGQPQAFRLPVDPQTRRLNYHKPFAPEQRAYAAAAPMAAAAPVARKVALAEADDYVAPVIETQGAFATEFEVPGKVTLPADGREVAVSLGMQTHAVTQRVQVTPGVNKTGVLVAEFERAAGVWLPGNIQLYRDGSYIGATRWQPDAVERFSFGFGQDDLLRVNVERKNQFAGSGGFAGQKNQRKVADTYVIDNLHKNAIEVLVLESAPVSQSEEIEVERLLQPPPTEVDWKGRPGVVGWKKQLAPNETWKINVGYTITYPKEGSVSGLP